MEQLNSINRYLPGHYRLKARNDGYILTWRDDMVHVHDFRDEGAGRTTVFETRQEMVLRAAKRAGVIFDINDVA